MLAMEAQENDPKSLRFLPPLMCLASHIIAVPVSAKNMASSEANLQSVRLARSFRTYWFDARSVINIVLFQFGKRLRLPNIFTQKAVIGLLADIFQ